MQKNTEQIILDTARKHFIKKGFSATRMQEIANDAHINKAMLHYYFRSKDNLYQEILRKTLDKVIPKFANAMATKGTFWERVEHLVDTYINTIIEYPEIPQFIMTELAQKRESFICEIQKHYSYFPAVKSFMLQIENEMNIGVIKKMPPIHLMLNILGMSVFPFMARPVISAVFEVSDEQFAILMRERKPIILDLLKNGLKIS